MRHKPSIPSAYEPYSRDYIEGIPARRLTLAGRGVYLALCLLCTFTLTIGTVGGILKPAQFWILALDVALCIYLSALFRSNARVLFLIHPIIIVIASQLFTTSFLLLGDGPSYEAVVRQYVDTSTASFQIGPLLRQFGLLDFFKYASLGVVPIYLVPDYLFSERSGDIYYLWQNTFHIALTALVVTLARHWDAIEERHLLPMALFAAVSPSVFDILTIPTRHGVTFFGVFLFFVSYLAVCRSFTAGRLAALTMAVLAILISKAPLLLPVLVFMLADHVLISRTDFTWRNAVMVGGALVSAVLLSGFFVEKTISYFQTISMTGAATFSYTTQLPLIGPIFKYLYAILAPFPWSKARIFVSTGVGYGGNWLLFAMHIASGLIGLYLFMVVIARARVLISADRGLKRSVAYGLIMSLSILAGATGFSGYLSIYYPFLAPLFAHRELQISLLFPVLFAATLEIFMLVAG